MTDRLFYRDFLNPVGVGGQAAILAIVPQADEGSSYCEDPTLEISDCRRSVAFDFDLYDKDGYVAALYKVDALLNAIHKFRDALVEEWQFRVELGLDGSGRSGIGEPSGLENRQSVTA